MKILILMRHGQASFQVASDGLRPLTADGEEQSKQAGQLLRYHHWIAPTILCSPLLRAKQSAALVAQKTGSRVQVAHELDGRLSAVGLIDFAMEQLKKADFVMLVGHNPNVSLAAAVLSGRYVSFGTGDVAVFDVTNPKKPILLLEKEWPF